MEVICGEMLIVLPFLHSEQRKYGIRVATEILGHADEVIRAMAINVQNTEKDFLFQHSW